MAFLMKPALAKQIWPSHDVDETMPEKPHPLSQEAIDQALRENGFAFSTDE